MTFTYKFKILLEESLILFGSLYNQSPSQADDGVKKYLETFVLKTLN